MVSVRAALGANPVFVDGPDEVVGDVRVSRQLYVQWSPEGLTSGRISTVRFAIDRPPNEVWPVFKDLGSWQGSHGRYSGVVGDLEGQTFRITSRRDPEEVYTYEVLRVVPEHVIVISGPFEEPPHSGGGYAEIGGRRDGALEILPGLYIFTIARSSGGTEANCFLQTARRDRTWTEEEALDLWRELAQQSRDRWLSSFIPTLKQLVSERSLGTR